MRKIKSIFAMIIIVAMVCSFVVGCDIGTNPAVEKFTVTFNSMGGTNVSTREVEKDKKVVKPANPSKNGYDFVGWFESDDEGETLYETPFDFQTPITANLILYAAWEEKTGETPTPEYGDHLIINQVYAIGDKNNDSQACSHSFIELYNPTEETIDLEGYSIQVGSNGTDETGKKKLDWIKLDLVGEIESQHSFLIVLKKFVNNPSQVEIDAGNVAPNFVLTQWNLDWDDGYMPNKNLKVCLMNNTEILTVANPFDIDGKGTKADDFVDLVGICGNDSTVDVDAFETDTFRGKEGQSKQKAARRINFADTDNNLVDFEILNYSKLSSSELQIYRPRSTYDGKWE